MGTAFYEDTPPTVTEVLKNIVPDAEGIPTWVGPKGEVVKIPGRWNKRYDLLSLTFGGYLLRTTVAGLMADCERDPIKFMRDLKAFAAQMPVE